MVEADFFDWVLDADGGPEFVRSLADRVSRFDWARVVEHDVLKILYESVIPASARASLGEYYTPDWLADRVVDHAVESPLEQRVLDPSCGSGTFLFHAIRRFLAASEEAGIPSSEAVSSVVNKVIGMDVHPVAVTLARVTYLLAIGRERLSSDDRGAIAIPVYLGDSMQWEQHADLLGGVDEVSVSTTGDDLVEGGGGALFGDDFVFLGGFSRTRLTLIASSPLWPTGLKSRHRRAAGISSCRSFSNTESTRTTSTGLSRRSTLCAAFTPPGETTSGVTTSAT